MTPQELAKNLTEILALFDSGDWRHAMLKLSALKAAVAAQINAETKETTQ